MSVSPEDLTARRESTQENCRDPRQLTNLAEILSCLSSYQSREAELSSSLAELVSNRDSVAESLRLLQSLAPQLDDLHNESTQLVAKVSSTARTALRVGGRVKSLDEEMSRVSQAVERVGHVMDLKVRWLLYTILQQRSDSAAVFARAATSMHREPGLGISN